MSHARTHIQAHVALTLGGELVLLASRSLGLEAGVTLVALGPDPPVMEDTDGVELTTTVDALHHAKGREGGREGGVGRLIYIHCIALFPLSSRFIVNVIILQLLEGCFGNV